MSLFTIILFLCILYITLSKRNERTVSRTYGVTVPLDVIDFMNEHENDPITSITIHRQPINPKNKTLTNIITFGKFNKNLKKTGYDELFHLSIVMIINNKKYRIEKESIVLMRDYEVRGNLRDTLKIPVNDEIYIDNLMDAAVEKYGEEQIFNYDPFTSNCQDYVYELLEASDLLDNKAKRFVKQNTAELANLNPYVKKFMQGTIKIDALIKIKSDKIERVVEDLDLKNKAASKISSTAEKAKSKLKKIFKF